MSDQTDEFLRRVKAKKKQFEADLAKLNVDTHDSTNETKKQLEKKIDEMTVAIKQAGENFTDSIAEKINGWLK
ncbi:MAG: hypothetical protein KDD61_14575 [Bdellovibrionales bacterium]|nr:hypothetical protein [Bdellovibrionales bacterium]